MDNEELIVDETSRKKIRENIHENYFVEAGAGSGKTTILVDRMVKMIEEDIDISLISAITFTKAAANEFYERFQKKLIEKSLENNEYKDKYLRALQNIDLAFMGTIDAFCNVVMSEHPTEGSIPSSAKVIDFDESQTIYKREYINIQNGLYDNEDLQSKGELFLKYDNKPDETFINTLNVLLSHRDCEVVIPKYQVFNLDTKYGDFIKTIRKIIDVLCKHPEFIISSNEEKAKSVRSSFISSRNTFKAYWDNNIPNLLYAFNHTFLSNDFRLSKDPKVIEELKEGSDYFENNPGKGNWLIVNKDKIVKIVEEINELRYAIILDFVCSAKDKILEKLRKDGSLTFNDYLVYLRDTLRKDAEGDGKLIKHISSRHQYFLIDEFQDTDPIQSEIFFYLAASKINKNWKDCVPRKGSLFIVGDPKQSIYRFKGADVSSYLNVEKMFNGQNGEVLHLFKNFRSTYVIKDWFNQTFKNLLIESLEQAPFKEIPLDDNNKSNGFSGVYTYEVPSRPKEEYEKDEYRVKNLILKLYDNENYKIDQIKKIDGKEVIINRKLDFKDFMIITPSKQALAKYTKVLKEAGIPYFVEGNIVFKESKAFKLFVDFFGAIVNPFDNRNLYSVLKSKLFNISEAELMGFKPLDISKDLDSLNLSNNLKDALKIIQTYQKDARVLSPSSLFLKIVENIEGFKKEGVENMEYVFFALELLKAKETNKEIITGLDAYNFLEKLLYESNDQERCPGLKKDGNQVHLANLHKVKGLEAPVVILAHPSKRSKEASFRMVRSDEGNKGYLFNVTKSLDNGASLKLLETKIYDDLKQEENDSAQFENLRLQYVAATRARNVLIIACSMTQKGISESNPWYNLLLGKLENIELLLANEKSKDINVKSIDYKDIEKTSSIIENNKEDLEKCAYELENPSKLAHININEYEETSDKVQKQIMENEGDSLSTIKGILVHRLMEILILTKDSIDKDSLINSIILENIPNDFKDKESYFKDLLSSIYDTLHNGGYTQKGNAPSDILSVIKSADEVYPEVPFTYLNNNHKLVNGIIDLIYIKDNEIHIIDFKTNRNANNLDELYKNQLEAYKKAIKDIIGKEVKDALIYHIVIN